MRGMKRPNRGVVFTRSGNIMPNQMRMGMNPQFNPRTRVSSMFGRNNMGGRKPILGRLRKR